MPEPPAWLMPDQARVTKRRDADEASRGECSREGHEETEAGGDTVLPFAEYYAALEKSCRTLATPHDDDPAQLYRDLVAAGITPTLVRGKIDFVGLEHVRLTPEVYTRRLLPNIQGLYELLATRGMDTAQRSLFQETP